MTPSNPNTLCKQCNKPYSAHLINGRYGVRHIFMPIDDQVLEKYDALEGADANDFCPCCGAHWPGRVSDYDLDKREELVQEVIEAAKNFWGRGAMDDLTTLAPKRQALLDAARKLAEFSP